MSMTVEEAIKELDLFRSEKKRYLKHGQSVDVLDIAISALEEVQKYRAIGTVSEFRELKEKATAKKRKTVKSKEKERSRDWCGHELL